MNLVGRRQQDAGAQEGWLTQPVRVRNLWRRGYNSLQNIDKNMLAGAYRILMRVDELHNDEAFVVTELRGHDTQSPILTVSPPEALVRAFSCAGSGRAFVPPPPGRLRRPRGGHWR
jgi:hypothetical protein